MFRHSVIKLFDVNWKAIDAAHITIKYQLTFYPTNGLETVLSAFFAEQSLNNVRKAFK